MRAVMKVRVMLARGSAVVFPMLRLERPKRKQRKEKRAYSAGIDIHPSQRRRDRSVHRIMRRDEESGVEKSLHEDTGRYQQRHCRNIRTQEHAKRNSPQCKDAACDDYSL